MPRVLRLVNPGVGKEALTLDEVLARASGPELEEKEMKVRRMRETFNAPPVVATHEEYSRELVRFHQHIDMVFYNVKFDMGGTQTRYSALDDLRRYYNIYEGEKNAISGRNGGFIGVIDAIAEGMVNKAIEAHIDGVLFDQIPPIPQVRYELAEEIIEKYWKVWFPYDDNVTHPFMIVSEIEKHIKNFVMVQHQLRRSGKFHS